MRTVIKEWKDRETGITVTIERRGAGTFLADYAWALSNGTWGTRSSRFAAEEAARGALERVKAAQVDA